MCAAITPRIGLIRVEGNPRRAGRGFMPFGDREFKRPFLPSGPISSRRRGKRVDVIGQVLGLVLRPRRNDLGRQLGVRRERAVEADQM